LRSVDERSIRVEARTTLCRMVYLRYRTKT
jgi:hypothetical protein